MKRKKSICCTTFEDSLHSTLTSLDLTGCHEILDSKLRVIGEKCPHLKNLDFSYCSQLSRLSLAAITKGCKCISSISFRGCYQFGLEEIKLITQELTELKSLDLSYCHYIDNETIYNLPATLTELSLEYCKSFTDVAIIHLAKKLGNNLSRLSLRGCTQLTDISGRALAFYCRKLERIDLSECNLITDQSIAMLAQRCNMSLRHLKLSNCPKITDRFTPYLAYFCKNLHLLDLKRCSLSNIGVKYIAKGCLHLHTLNIDGNRVDDEALRALVSLSSLRALDLSWCMKISISGLTKFVQECSSQLHTIALWGLNFSDEQLQDIMSPRPQRPALNIVKRFRAITHH
eukprot:TRINITY_DN8253_c0_g1_i3.p1 TRINITY_DN8253_c0_g1~~TRINITY_DN8253_c0_g1_i3.p1  ORF type:complete len:344 (+),score=2.50 TRINITY_DN8253_c0_g1_i3:105-1136(+)